MSGDATDPSAHDVREVRDEGDVRDAGDVRDELSPGRRAGSGAGRAAVIVAASVALLVVAIAAFSFGRISTLAAPTPDATPADTSAEAGFARDMQVHHLQGTELAMIVREVSDDPEVRTLAYDIATTQSQQAGQLYGWLSAWDLSQAGSEPSMTWMTRPALDGSVHDSHAGHEPGGPMPGLATRAQIEQLRSLRGIEADRLFLELMIAHHRGAVEMADAALERASNHIVVSFARAVSQSQAAEIALMERLLAERS
ncbi:DUF305 domain-containing protein [Agromyces ramosus]|uniref:Uncharacterized protein (DUF305 family) n=1 Tax=Agromyces ramosus TaxID=33879 RepID=A0ABU0R9N2_9MICO|nr:DUF305 domain-containing protein [Agromyces ramosus]MDQ0894797.1 uncharacterized protein (DUF305 family) [Agromyces ramosus]